MLTMFIFAVYSRKCFVRNYNIRTAKPMEGRKGHKFCFVVLFIIQVFIYWYLIFLLLLLFLFYLSNFNIVILDSSVIILPF